MARPWPQAALPVARRSEWVGAALGCLVGIRVSLHKCCPGTVLPLLPCQTCAFALPNGAFQTAEWAVLLDEKARVAKWLIVNFLQMQAMLSF